MQKKNRNSRKRAAENGLKVCFATKNTLPREEMLRFVVSPAPRTVFFDVNETLPGAGIWFTADKQIVQTAIDKRLFYKAAGGTVHIPQGLLDEVEKQLKEKCLHFLSLARKAGLLVFGFENVKKALTAGDVAVAFEAADSAQNGKDKLFRPADDFPIFTFLSREDLGEITGQDTQVHTIVLKSNLATKLITAARKTERFIQDSTKG